MDSGAGRTVYVLWHEYQMPDGCDDLKFLGVYSSRERAEAYKLVAMEQPGFRRTREGFEVTEYEIDNSDCWPEGFATFYEGEWLED